MSSTNSKSSTQSGQRMVSAVEKLRYRFYEPLVLFWILNPGTRHTISLPSTDHHAKRFPHSWRSFLDALAWFGDHQHGGETVTAVGGENQQPGVTYWVCARHRGSFDHIVWLLGRLEAVTLIRSKTDLRVTENEIVDRSVERSKDKIRSYCKSLRDNLEKAMRAREIQNDPIQDSQDQTQSPQSSQDIDRAAASYGHNVDDDSNGSSDSEDSDGDNDGDNDGGNDGGVPISTSPPVRTRNADIQTMADMIRSLRAEEMPLSEVCIWARQFPYYRLLERLIRTTDTPDTPSIWLPVRHYLFRLGAWHRKARVLVGFASIHPAFLDQFTCEFLPLPGPTSYPEPDEKTNLKSALKRMLPADKQSRAEELYEQLLSLRGFDLAEAFVEAFQNRAARLEVHAESYLLDHFFLDRRVYTLQDKYIGCSKPSCYCCSLYQKHHPDNPVLRSSHGNAWPKWCPPLMAGVHTSEAVAAHNLTVMNSVVASIRRDVIYEIERRLPRRQRPPDSSSGVDGILLGLSTVTITEE